MRPKDAASSSFASFNLDEKERDAMTRSTAVAAAEPTLHAALELSKNGWLLAIRFPDRGTPSLYPLRGGDAEGLMAKTSGISSMRRGAAWPRSRVGRRR